jgi:hypothetical protein
MDQLTYRNSNLLANRPPPAASLTNDGDSNAAEGHRKRSRAPNNFAKKRHRGHESSESESDSNADDSDSESTSSTGTSDDEEGIGGEDEVSFSTFQFTICSYSVTAPVFY